MKVGVFLGSQHPPEADIRREFEHMVEQTRAIRDAGFDSLWLGQHYLTYPQPVPADHAPAPPAWRRRPAIWPSAPT